MRAPRKVLVVRMSSIGDIVLTSAAVRCLKEQTDCEVHYFTKAAYAPLLEANPHIDRVVCLKDSLGEVIPLLKAENYDCIIDLHNNLRSRRLSAALNVPCYRMPKANVAKWLMVNVKSLAPKEVLHVVLRSFEPLKQLQVKYDGRGLDHFIAADDHVDVKELDPRLEAGNYVAVSVGAKFKTKVLPLAKQFELVESISKPVVLLGGSDDAEAAEQITARYDHVTNCCGTLSIQQSASVVQQCEYAVTHDTGLMHIAAAFKKPLVTFWGNTIPGIGMTPFLPNDHQGQVELREVANLSCRPCSKIGYATCPKGHHNCMQLQDVRIESSLGDLA